ncbi:molybdopterin converting factor subunit 1 [Robiginitalea sp.]|uniref:molybdopterin converting factor subunit 1 n=1 Tax=Robiginitalea sp. TaxID=1902411 RepID=UPI003C630C76
MRVLLFGVTRDIVKCSSIDLNAQIAAGIQTVGDLKKHLSMEYPKLAELTSLAVAVNQQYAEENHPLGNKDEIALIPPVSGG